MIGIVIVTHGRLEKNEAGILKYEGLGLAFWQTAHAEFAKADLKENKPIPYALKVAQVVIVDKNEYADASAKIVTAAKAAVHQDPERNVIILVDMGHSTAYKQALLAEELLVAQGYNVGMVSDINEKAVVELAKVSDRMNLEDAVSATIDALTESIKSCSHLRAVVSTKVEAQLPQRGSGHVAAPEYVLGK